MNKKQYIQLLKKVNNSNWWHALPRDSASYAKRGKFLASTYKQAEFYGRPNLIPEQIEIKKPLLGYSELEILNILFGEKAEIMLSKVLNSNNYYEERIQLDSKMAKTAKLLGYDSIILMTRSAKNAIKNYRKPNSIELNLLNRVKI